MNQALVLDTDIDVRDYLEAHFQVTKKDMLEVVRNAAFAYMDSTDYHPVIHGGSSAWFEIVRSLRELLLPQGWEILYEEGLDKTVNDDLGLSIICTSGNAGVCRSPFDEGPLLMSKNEKGGSFKRALEHNRSLIPDLFEDQDFLRSKVDNNSTWALIYHIDKTEKELRAELSLPISLTSQDKIGQWQTRLFLGSISLDELRTVSPSVTDEFNDEIEFSIRSKSDE